MLIHKALPIVMMAGLALAGCKERPDTTRTSTQTDTKQVGSTSESTSQTKVGTSSGETTFVTNSYQGTVTAFVPGKSIEVMTGNKETHSFALDGKTDVLVIDPITAVGSKILLVEEKGEKAYHKITITIAPAA
jgi:hypothetical protein